MLMSLISNMDKIPASAFITLGSALIGGVIASFATNFNNWLKEFYLQRKQFIETNKVITSQLVNGWYILSKINICIYLRNINIDKASSLQIDAIDSELKKVYEFLKNDHQVEELSLNHKRCEEYVDKLESYDSFLAYRLRGAHHDVIEVCNKLRWFLGEYCETEVKSKEKIKKFINSSKTLIIHIYISQFEKIIKELTFKYLVIDHISFGRYFNRKNIDYKRYYTYNLILKQEHRYLRKIKVFCHKIYFFVSRAKSKRWKPYIILCRRYRTLCNIVRNFGKIAEY